MRRKIKWTEADAEKLRSMAGNRPIDEIAQELARPQGSVSRRAHQLNMSLAFHRHRENPPAQPRPQGLISRRIRSLQR
jgi:hypothetical protein